MPALFFSVNKLLTPPNIDPKCCMITFDKTNSDIRRNKYIVAYINLA
uniref:Uncharacterized protein n=1 Tax=Arundo donax TaxID=35708 RepID=A0A0A9C293_ARUDO